MRPRLGCLVCWTELVLFFLKDLPQIKVLTSSYSTVIIFYFLDETTFMLKEINFHIALLNRSGALLSYHGNAYCSSARFISLTPITFELGATDYGAFWYPREYRILRAFTLDFFTKPDGCICYDYGGPDITMAGESHFLRPIRTGKSICGCANFSAPALKRSRGKGSLCRFV